MTMRRVPFFSWSALITSIAMVLVMPVFVGTLIYLFLDHRNARDGFGGNSGFYTWAGWLFTQPATYLFAIPAIGLFAELLPVTFRKRTPARGVMIAGLGLISVAALAAVTQQNVQRLPWSGSELNLDDLGTKVEDLVPFTYFNLLPLLGMLIVILMGLALAKPQKGVRPNVNPAFAFGLFGYGMVFVGMLGTVLYAVDDLALQGTVFEEAALDLHRLRRRARRDGRRRLLGAEAVGQRTIGGQARPAGAARRARHRARHVPALHRRLPRPTRRTDLRQRRPRHLEHPRPGRARPDGPHRAGLHRAPRFRQPVARRRA